MTREGNISRVAASSRGLACCGSGRRMPFEGHPESKAITGATAAPAEITTPEEILLPAIRRAFWIRHVAVDFRGPRQLPHATAAPNNSSVFLCEIHSYYCREPVGNLTVGSSPFIGMRRAPAIRPRLFGVPEVGVAPTGTSLIGNPASREGKPRLEHGFLGYLLEAVRHGRSTDSNDGRAMGTTRQPFAL